jgi:3-dehydroquinate synthase
MAEVIKYGCISNKALFEKLEAIKSEEELFEKLDDIIYTCCDIKRGIVERDEKDTGERMILNFGHTLGHAIEKYYNFDTYTHGEGVAIGMYLISKKSEEFGLTEKGVAKRIFNILENFGLPTEADTKKEEMLRAIGVDKKNIGGSINFILLKEIGEVFIHKVDKEEVVKFI